MEQLIEPLAGMLEQPRPLSPQVLRHLASAHGVETEEIGAFFSGAWGGLEEFELDLLLAPLFTPTLDDQVAIARELGDAGLDTASLVSLIARLVARPVRARLAGPDGTEYIVTLPEVAIDRYVRRMRLEGGIPAELAGPLAHAARTSGLPAPFLRAIARRAVWELPGRAAILGRWMERAEPGAGIESDLRLLLRLVEAYQPADPAEFLERIPGWIDSVRRDAESARQPRPFFNDRVEDLHGGGRDQRRAGDVKAAERAEELAGLRRLHAAMQ
jgi:hypothetical protein